MHWLTCRELFKHLDKAEQILGKQRFIAGDQLTEADVRLFMTLIRFDEVSARRGDGARCSVTARRHTRPSLALVGYGTEARTIFIP